MDLHLVSIVDDYKIKTDATWLKMMKIKIYAIRKEMLLHFALRAMTILVMVIIVSCMLYLCALGSLLDVCTKSRTCLVHENQCKRKT